jgi:hypothetical protein
MLQPINWGIGWPGMYLGSITSLKVTVVVWPIGLTIAERTALVALWITEAFALTFGGSCFAEVALARLAEASRSPEARRSKPTFAKLRMLRSARGLGLSPPIEASIKHPE